MFLAGKSEHMDVVFATLSPVGVFRHRLFKHCIHMLYIYFLSIFLYIYLYMFIVPFTVVIFYLHVFLIR